MTNRFLMSVAAAALIAGTGFASAQGTGTSREPSGGSSIQQNAPSDQTKSPSGMKSSQSDEKAAQPGAKNQRAQDDMKAGAKGEKSAQDNNMKGEKSAQDNNMKGEKSKSMSSENDKSKAGKDMKAEGREDRNGMKAEQKGAADSKSQTTQTGQTGQTTQSQTTTGQVGAGAKLSGEQRTKITSVFREQRVAPAANVNFSIAVGTRVPRTVSFHPLPREIVAVYPEWRGYEYFLVNNQIIVVNPRTLEIVDVIDV
jgi:hypothetical protein